MSFIYCSVDPLAGVGVVDDGTDGVDDGCDYVQQGG